MSLMTTSRPLLVMFASSVELISSSLSRLPICMDCESCVPLGHMAAATLGACWRAFTKTCPAAAATPEMRGPASGPAMNDRPTDSAVRIWLRRTFVFCGGSISVTMDWILSCALVVANARALYHVVKKLLMATVKVSCVSKGHRQSHTIYVLKHIVDFGSNALVHTLTTVRTARPSCVDL